MPEVPINLHNHMELDLQLIPERLEPLLRWEMVYGNDRPVEIEIGSGKGAFLVEVGRRFPERNFLGIEYWKRRWQYTLERVTKHALTNVRVAGVDAISFVTEYVVPRSVQVFHVYFPDPWPKRRHCKRRLFTPEFVAIVSERLAPEGLLHVATDHGKYAAQIQPLLDSHEELEQVLPTPEPIVRTNFEAKYLCEGRAIYRFTYRKLAYACTNGTTG